MSDAPSAMAVPTRSVLSRVRRTPHAGERGRGIAKPVLLGAAGIVAAVGVWAILSATGTLNPDAIPGPWPVGQRVADLLTDRVFLEALGGTLRTWAWSLLVSTVVAVPVGLALGYLPFLERPVLLVVDAARSVPGTALIPVAILLWGLGNEMKSALVIYSVFWPLLLNSLYGSRGVDPVMKTVARSLRWSGFKVVRRVVLPAAAPAIVTGIRVAAAIGLIVILSAELLGATDGVGTIILRYQNIQEPDFVYAGVVVVGLLGMLIALGLTWLDRRILPWSPANRKR
ncbi:ABC transporter permease [Desertimonas flava]|uniref:ABC transporter permease n=1 Tax=Desertimonas flava TaxID=2064846 RepID=UPI000E34230E|nr:ABC transporter permease [Desertimonas flava]